MLSSCPLKERPIAIQAEVEGNSPLTVIPVRAFLNLTETVVLAIAINVSSESLVRSGSPKVFAVESERIMHVAGVSISVAGCH